jgi:tetraacyldisaccharide 4'-kinase
MESINKRKRADIIIVTKTDPAITDKELADIRNELQTSGDQKVFFTKIDYGAPVPVFNEENAGRNLFSLNEQGETGAILITGIASPAGIIKYLGQFFSEIVHLGFPDHHYFKGKDLDRINAALQNLGTSQKILITTEKDAVRLREFTNIAPGIKSAFYYLPVEVSFLKENKNVFDSLIFDYVGKNKRNS